MDATLPTPAPPPSLADKLREFIAGLTVEELVLFDEVFRRATAEPAVEGFERNDYDAIVQQLRQMQDLANLINQTLRTQQAMSLSAIKNL